MKRRLSLRLRLAFGLTGAMGIVWLLAMLASGFTLRHEVDELSQSLLALTAERLLPLALETLSVMPPVRDTAPYIVSDIVQGDDSFIWVLRSIGEGMIVMQMPRIDSDLLSAPLTEGHSRTENFEVYTRISDDGRYALQVGETRAGRTEALRETVQALAAPLILLLLPLSLYFVMWISRRALRPVDDLSKEVAGRGARDLSPLGDADLPVELRPIHDAVDALLERLRRALDAERSFASNAAHEMRTPIAATLAQTQRLIAEAPEGPLRRRALGIERELARIARLSEKLLELARAEGGGVLSPTAHDLVPVIRLVLREMGDPPTGWDITLPETLPSYLDRDAFGVMLRNLTENAVKHGDAAQPIRVELTEGGELTVSNGGRVITPQALGSLTTRFERAGASAQGAGLGLAIVATVAQNAGIAFSLASPAPGRPDGFCARVDLSPLL
ncbi:sensor histidine kinase [Albirhodobacter sp. R86504]|uniref:sensor histidine kinase n=1 Tax=Albirhodobacter sp. R86504 TaxID=3093848 RepID=UPI00366D44F3